MSRIPAVQVCDARDDAQGTTAGNNKIFLSSAHAYKNIW